MAEILTDYYEITDYLVKKKIVENSKEINKLLSFERKTIQPSEECIDKAKDVIYWLNKDILSAEKRIEHYLDEIEHLRKMIRSSENLIANCNYILELLNIT